jgi:hypothetical protein
LNGGALTANPWAVTIGGGIAVALLIWLGKRVFGIPGKREGTRKLIQQTASPVVTQTFQPTINIHSPVATTAQTISQTRHKKGTLGEGEPALPLPRFEYRGPREKDVFVSPSARSGITDPHDGGI